ATVFADDAKLTKSIETDIRTLAAPNMEGRGLGTKGIGLAANYIEGRLRALGLQPAFGKSYRQPFPVKMGVSLGSGNKLEGVAAVIFTTGPIQDEGKDKVPPLVNDGPESPAGIPVIQVKTSVAERWLKDAGIDLAQFQKDVDTDLKPRSRVLAANVSGVADV